MSDKLFVKPARPGLIVRDPVTLQPLPEFGAAVPNAVYWIRRLRFGDVVETTEREIAAGKAKAEVTVEAATNKAAEVVAKDALAETDKPKRGDK